MAKPLKIGLVVDDTLDKTDGVQQYVLGVGAWLSKQGHDVHYLVGETTRHDIPNVHSLSRNMHVRFNGNRLSIPLPTSRSKLKSFLRHEKFDVLHVQLPYSPFLAKRLITAASEKTAVIGTFHILPHSKLVSISSRLLGLWLRRSLKRFDQIYSVSAAAQSFASKTFRIESQVLPNVFDYNLFSQARPLTKYEGKIPTILFLGRLVPRKGCQTLLEAALKVRHEHPKMAFRLVICGKGPLNDSLQEYASKNDMNSYVEFVGFVSEADKPRYYASSDLTVFPSKGGESFGIVLLEAMASGKAAVLAGDNPGYRSVMQPHPELLFNPHSSRGLAQKIHTYLSDDTQRHQAQTWGKDYVKAFDTPVIGQKLVTTYQQALRKRS